MKNIIQYEYYKDTHLYTKGVNIVHSLWSGDPWIWRLDLFTNKWMFWAEHPLDGITEWRCWKNEKILNKGDIFYRVTHFEDLEPMDEKDLMLELL